MKTRKTLLLVILLLAISIIMSVSAQDTVTLKWFMRWDQARVDNVAMPLIEQFEATHENINIEFENIGTSTDYYTKLQITIAGGTAPDVFYPATHVAYALARKGVMLSLNDYIERDGIDLAAYDPAILDLYTIDGELYCLPIDSAALVVYYNKDIFDAAGVPYPEAGWTWDDFLATAQALTQDLDGDGRIDIFGVDQFRNYWPMVVWSNTGRYLFDDIRNPTEFIAGSDPAAINSVQWIADLTLVHNVMPSDDERADISDMFAAGKAAMQVVGHWRFTQYQTAGINFNVAPLPIGEYGEPVNRADGSCFAISASTAHPEEAWEFVKFLAGPDSEGVNLLLDLQVMTPALVEFQMDERFLHPDGMEDFNGDAFNAGRENLFTMYDPIHPMYSAFDALWKAELGEVWIGEATAEEAFARISEQVQDILENIEDYE